MSIALAWIQFNFISRWAARRTHSTVKQHRSCCVLSWCSPFVFCSFAGFSFIALSMLPYFTVCERIVLRRMFIRSSRLYRPSSLSVPADKLVLRLWCDYKRGLVLNVSDGNDASATATGIRKRNPVNRFYSGLRHLSTSSSCELHAKFVWMVSLWTHALHRQFASLFERSYQP